LTLQIASALEEHLSPRGVAVIIEGQHSCMQLRGVRQPDPVMTTMSLRGVYRDHPESRREILTLLRTGATAG
ncbi:MAG: GTP cyclohydrolase I, partial [Phycisphaerales bacterium]|nr:GTP cyclohydrolase I [Phycisphaerales bacterium]